MLKLFNEVGYSLVIGAGNWILASHEIEDGDDEVRKWGLIFPPNRVYEGWYIRIWIWKIVFIFSSKNGWKTQKKGKIGLKCILWFQYLLK